MNEFTEKHHAYLVGAFYMELMKACPEKAEAVFIMCTQRYAEQRGSRMAQRAIRDGRILDFTTYREYGEWTNTEAVIKEGHGNSGETILWSPDHIEKVYMCPWAAQFKAMALEKCGTLYCLHVDQSLVRGFNPALTYEVPQSMHENSCCIQISKEANFRENQEFHKHSEYRQGFSYHCGHCFKTFKEIVEAILEKKGMCISRAVLQSFIEHYGKEMADCLISFEHENFNII